MTPVQEKKRTLEDIEREIDIILTTYNDTIEFIEDPDAMAEFEDEMARKLDEMEDAEAVKIDGYGHGINKLETEEERLAAVIKRLTARKKSVSSKVAWMKGNLLKLMREYGKEKIEGTVYIARINNGESVVVTVPSSLPEKLRTMEIKPDKAAIKKELKAGNKVPGATLVKTESVSVK